MTKQIHFLLLERLEGYVFNPPRPEGLTFVDAESGVEIAIWASRKKEDDSFGYRNLELRATV
ncbi:MAG: hypothetical protein ACRC14_05820, partial [Paracoccaceae bacterium]